MHLDEETEFGTSPALTPSWPWLKWGNSVLYIDCDYFVFREVGQLFPSQQGWTRQPICPLNNEMRGLRITTIT